MDGIDLLLYIVIGIVLLIIIIGMVRGFSLWRKRKKIWTKTPRVRGKAILRDDDVLGYGSGIVYGYEFSSNKMDMANVGIFTPDGKAVKIPYHKSQIVPDNPFQAMCGDSRALWRVVPIHSVAGMSDNEKIKISKLNKRLIDDNIILEAEKKIEKNEAAVIPDQMLEIIKEFNKGGKSETFITPRK